MVPTRSPESLVGAGANLTAMLFYLSFQPKSFHFMTVLGVEKGKIRSLRQKKTDQDGEIRREREEAA